jgi:hypothetical protein
MTERWRRSERRPVTPTSPLRALICTLWSMIRSRSGVYSTLPEGASLVLIGSGPVHPALVAKSPELVALIRGAIPKRLVEAHLGSRSQWGAAFPVRRKRAATCFQ